MIKVEQKINIEVEGHKLAISRESAKELHKQLGKLFESKERKESIEDYIKKLTLFKPQPLYVSPYVPPPVYGPAESTDFPYEVT
jgi:hypothetical protein